MRRNKIKLMENTKGKKVGPEQEAIESTEKLAPQVSAIRYQVFQGIKLQHGDFLDPNFLSRNIEQSFVVRDSNADNQVTDLLERLVQRFGKPVVDEKGDKIHYPYEFFCLYYEDKRRNTMDIVGVGNIAPENDLAVKVTGRNFNHALFAVNFIHLESGYKFLEILKDEPFNAVRNLVRSELFESGWFVKLRGQSSGTPDVIGAITRLYLGENTEPLFPSIYEARPKPINVIENGKTYEKNEYIRVVGGN